MKTMRKLHLILILFLIHFISLAQENELENIKNLYQNEIEKNQNTQDVERMISKANLNYMIQNYATAEKLYLKLLNKDALKGNDLINAAITFVHNNKPSLAQEMIGVYVSENPTDRYQWEGKIDEFIKYKELNKGATLSGSILNNTTAIQYLGNNEFIAFEGNKFQYLKILDDNIKVQNKTYPSVINNSFHKIGRFYLDEENQRLFFTHISKDGDMSIFTAVLRKNATEWGKFKEILKAEVGKNYCSPYYDAKNKLLYFSESNSDNNYIIKKASFDGKNLGKLSEVPFQPSNANNFLSYIEVDRLYFYSNAYPSEAYDYFEYESNKNRSTNLSLYSNLNKTNEWLVLVDKELKNYYNIVDVANHPIFIHNEVKEKACMINGTVKDQNSPIKNAVILAQDIKVHHSESDERGNFNLNLKNDKAYRMKIMAEGYEFKDTVLKTKDLNEIDLKFHLKPLAVEQVYVTKNITDTENNTITNETKSENIESTSYDDIPLAKTYEVVESTEIVETNEVVESTEVINYEIAENESRYYVIIGSSPQYDNAYSYWSKWSSKFSDLSIIEEPGKPYRIGIYTGSNKFEATQKLRKVQKQVKNAWIYKQ